MRILFVLAGMHRIDRGAEVAFESIATEIARAGGDHVVVVGSGRQRPDRPYTFLSQPAISRTHFERAPRMPLLRHEYAYEDATFVAGYLARYRPSDFDVTVTCSFPSVNWMLTRWPPFRSRPAHIFVTQNGDWPAYSKRREFRSFRCDGLVCTNPDYFERNLKRWHCALIPNGIDSQRFHTGPGARDELGLPLHAPIVIMVSALVETKRVLEGVRAVAAVHGAFLVVAGDGPLRDEFDALAGELLPGRFRRMILSAADMPKLYRSGDVFLHTALHESFGNVYIEAAACGIPVVVHDFPGTRWIFGEHSGLVDATSTAALSNALQHALAGEQGDTAALAAATAERFAWSEIAHQYRAFLNEVIERRHAHPGRSSSPMLVAPVTVCGPTRRARLIDHAVPAGLRMLARLSRQFLSRRGVGFASRVAGRLLSRHDAVCFQLSGGGNFVVDRDDRLWLQVLLVEQRYEPDLDSFFARSLRECDVVLDCGANLGLWSVVASQIIRDPARIVSVEAGARTFALLQRNWLHNGRSFTTLNRALSDTTGDKVSFYSEPSDHAASSMIEAFAPTTALQETVTTVSLLDLLDSRNGDRASDSVTFVKLDIEGMEQSVIATIDPREHLDVVLLYEEHGRDADDATTRLVLKCGFSVLFLADDGTVERIDHDTIERLRQLKVDLTHGYNLAAVAPGGRAAARLEQVYPGHNLSC